MCLKYAKNGRDYENLSAPLSAVQFHLHSPSAMSPTFVILGDVVRLKPVLIWKGEPNGKMKKELTALTRNSACPGIEQMVTAKGRNNEATMIFIVRETLMGTIPLGEGEKECMRLTAFRVICMLSLPCISVVSRFHAYFYWTTQWHTIYTSM